MMKNIDDLIELNRYEPIERYKKIVCEENREVQEMSSKILLSLNVIDTVLRQYCNTDYHFYIKGDESIYCLLLLVFDENNINKQDFDKAMFILDFSKLIYRFTCAKKFKEDDTDIFQLRLNSWGRAYIDSCFLASHEDFKAISEYFCKYCKENIYLYTRLTKALLKDLNNETIEEINEVNDMIEIKLLS